MQREGLLLDWIHIRSRHNLKLTPGLRNAPTPSRRELRRVRLDADSYKGLRQQVQEFGTPPAPSRCEDAAFYAGWYSLDHYNDAFTWKPGAIGIHLEQRFRGRSPRRKQLVR